MAELQVFVAHGFDDRLYTGGVVAFRRKARVAMRRAEKSCRKQGMDVILTPFFVSRDFGRRLPGIVREALEASSVGVFDLTGLRPNVLYEMGYFFALRRPSVVIMRHGTKLPADVTDVLAGVYKQATDLPDLMTSRLEGAIREVRGQGAGRPRSLRNLWFPYDPPVVSLVCSPEPERSRFASRADANYLFIDNLEDRDALFEVATYLSRTFPATRVDRYASDSIIQEALRGDLVVIGGPGETSDPGNHVCRDILNLLQANIKYGDNCKSALFRDREYVPEFDTNGHLIRDYSYFIREKNPYNSDRTVVVMCGVYTAGTLGAALAFSDHPQAERNAAIVRRALRVDHGHTGCFEAFFSIDVAAGGSVACPKIGLRQIVRR